MNRWSLSADQRCSPDNQDGDRGPGILSSGDLIIRSFSNHHAPMARGRAMTARMVASIALQRGCCEDLLVVEEVYIPPLELSHPSPSRGD